jgi:uncharacterized protein YgiM (DUF1202 family)
MCSQPTVLNECEINIHAKFSTSAVKKKFNKRSKDSIDKEPLLYVAGIGKNCNLCNVMERNN